MSHVYDASLSLMDLHVTLQTDAVHSKSHNGAVYVLCRLLFMPVRTYHRNFDDTSSTELHADTDEYTEKKTCEATDQFENKRVGDNRIG